MNIFSKIFSKKELIEGGACPNCWGEQEYDGQVRNLLADKQLDVNNHEARHAFIRDFVVNHVSGIRLQKDNDGYQCPMCKRKF
ncbi:hypothetical protein QQ008_14275 [Fulvivirgaceae bacterium BMA10]|uniref:Uncharacterized protein n=1 Tax=Splendidivirga corallicola TaxID=3051826 RepID=A0ABT8KPA5_9BACT|nr:hypothetical protein [Fulvivirgaceae bacterium BMA10]